MLQKEKERCKEFIEKFRTPTLLKTGAGGLGDALYLQRIAAVAAGQPGSERFQIALDDVQLLDPPLALAIIQNTRRYTDLFAAAIDELLPAPERVVDNGSSIADVMQMARLNRLEANGDAAGADGEPAAGAGGDPLPQYFPPRLHRRYEVRFTPVAADAAKPLRLRDIGSGSIGKFVTANCMVIRATDVKPLIEVASYAWCVRCKAGAVCSKGGRGALRRHLAEAAGCGCAAAAAAAAEGYRRPQCPQPAA